MNETITLAQMWQMMLAICAGIVTISTAVGVVVKVVHTIKAPERKQNARIEALELKMKDIDMRLEKGDRHFDRDGERIDNLEKTMRASNRIIIETLQALTAHAIDGNNTDQLKRQDNKLNDFLIDKI